MSTHAIHPSHATVKATNKLMAARGLFALTAFALGAAGATAQSGASAPSPSHSASASVSTAAKSVGKTVGDVIKESKAADWRPLNLHNTLVMEFASGEVVIELAPQFAPRHVDNIRALTQGGYDNGLAVVRVQDNYVTQWADPNDDDDVKDKSKARALGTASATLPAEFSTRLKGLPLTVLPDRDEWAPLTGFMDGMPVAGDLASNTAWLAHCYGVVGAARGNAPDSSNGTSLYVIIGHAPRNLDLNITTVGRVVKGADLLASMPRGPGAMGFYDKPEKNIPIIRARMLSDMPASERPAIEIMRTDTPTWQALVEAGRNPGGQWYVHRPGHTNICNRSVPTRAVTAATGKP